MTPWPADPVDVAGDLETEVGSLRSDLRDLVAVLSLPLIWRGRAPPQILENLAEVLVSLLRLDVLHLRLEPTGDGDVLEETRDRRSGNDDPPLDDMVDALAAGTQPPSNGRLRLTRVRPGVHSEEWLVIAGSRRDDFPTERERFLLRVTVEQAAVSVETARLYHEAQQASTAKSQFIATMSHELRTPLNAILGYVDLLQLGVPETLPDGSKPYVDRVQASARHLLDMIDSILSFARIEAGHEEMHSEDLDLGELTTSIVQLVEPLARKKGLAIECTVPSGGLTLVTDPAKVRQVLFNLLSNAIKFTDEGRVTVTLEREDTSVVIQVSDTGAGIPAAAQDRIFEPFRQVEGTLTRRAGGTGLGLSVARHLSELLGGRLDLESEVGKGSTFTVRLPLS